MSEQQNILAEDDYVHPQPAARHNVPAAGHVVPAARHVVPAAGHVVPAPPHAALSLYSPSLPSHEHSLAKTSSSDRHLYSLLMCHYKLCSSAQVRHVRPQEEH